MTPLLTLGQAAALMQFRDVRTLKKALAEAGILTIGIGRRARLEQSDIALLKLRLRAASARDLSQQTPAQKRAETRRLRLYVNSLPKAPR